MVAPLDLTFYAHIASPASVALWQGLPLAHPLAEDTAAVDDPRRLWLWIPHMLLGFEGTLDTLDALVAAGWERLPATFAQLDTSLYHIVTQLNDLRSVQYPGQSDRDVWVRSADLRHAQRYPVALAFTLEGIPIEASTEASLAEQHVRGETYTAVVPEVLPPPTIGTRGLVHSHRKADASNGWQVYTLDDLPPAERELQTRLADALRELVAPHEWYVTAAAVSQERAEQMYRARSKYPPDIWLQRWGDIQQMAHNLAAAYWERHQQATPPAAQLPVTYDVFHSGYAMVATPLNALHISQGLSSAVWRTRDGSGAPYWRGESAKGRDKGENVVTEMELRLEDATEPPLPVQEQAAQLWRIVNAHSDLDGDLFLAMWAQYLSAPRDADGYTHLTGNMFLGYRGIEPITKADTPDGDRRRAGHRTEDMQEISAALVRQMAVWLKVRAMIEASDDPNASGSRRGRPRRRTRRLYTHESRLWLVSEVVRQHELAGVAPEGASSHIVAWRYRPGTWSAPFLEAPSRPFALLCQTTLQYDPYREQWEKRLARYFVFHLRMSGGPNYGGTRINRQVATLLAELELPTDAVHPKRTRERFERALARLVEDGIIDAWDYAPDNPSLPARNWLPTWEQWHIRVTAAPLPHAPEGGQSDAAPQGE